MTLLALETSCDETSAAVVRDGIILSNIVSSQIKLHAEYGGVVPELAAREHLKNLTPVTQSALRAAGISPNELDAIAATQGPGLAIALLVGFKAAQAMAFALGKPFIGINHHEAHLYSPWISSPSPLLGEKAGVRGENVVGQSNASATSNDQVHPSPSIPLPSEGRGKPDLTPSELAALLAPERAEDLKKWLRGRDVLDVVTLATKPLTFTELLPLLRKLTPRLYSISSSPKAHPGEVHLTVGAVRYESFGRNRKGVASTFLADLADNAGFVKVFVQPAHGFKPPANGDTPMIMVGPGTGIAPFRAFLEERAAAGAKGKNWLFFGDQKRDADFLYEEQLTGWQQSGFLTRLDLAFSRDLAEKIYVQYRMI